MSGNGNGDGVLVLGGAGMLGRAWGEALGSGHTAVTRAQLDLERPAEIDRWVTAAVHTVINCTAWTDVDEAEEHEAQAMRVNGEAVGRLAERCRQVGATLVHYSTDYVFNGQAREPYRPDQPREPVNAYGRTKAEGERRIEEAGGDCLLIRTSWLYAPWGKNFVRTMAKLTAQKPQLRVVDDQRGRPTSCQHLVRATRALLDQGARGTYHVTDGGQCTWHELTCEIARRLGHGCEVQPCTSAEFPRPAKRPAYSVLDLSKTETLIGPMPEWQANLAAVLAQLPMQEAQR